MFKNKYLQKVRSPEEAQRIPRSGGCITRGLCDREDVYRCDFGRDDRGLFPDAVPEYAALLPGYGYLRGVSA